MVLALTPALVCAQFGGMPGLSGLPSFGGLFGSSSGCGDKAAGPGLAPAVYFGWMPGQDNNVGASLNAKNLGAFGLLDINFKYKTEGFWLGGALPVQISDNLTFIGTGWYLFPSDSTASLNESQNQRDQHLNLLANDWTKKDIWWFLDGVLAYGSSNFAAIAGFRYDKFSTNFSGANQIFVDGQNIDLISQAYIPLIGVQAGYKNSVSSLNVRMIGFPTMLGNTTANFTIDDTNRFEGTGTYNGGHFFELFAEYARQIFVNGDAGVFVRWNSTRVTSDVNATTTLAPTTDDYLMSFNRNTWTLGGKVGLSF
jgi:hypothetical protein